MDAKTSHFRQLLTTWRELHKLPNGQVDTRRLQELGISTSNLNIEDPEKERSSRQRYFKPLPVEEFKAIPAYNIPDEFPQYRTRDDHANYHYETGVDLHHLFSNHLFHHQWVVPPGPSNYRLSLNPNWVSK